MRILLPVCRQFRPIEFIHKKRSQITQDNPVPLVLFWSVSLGIWIQFNFPNSTWMSLSFHAPSCPDETFSDEGKRTTSSRIAWTGNSNPKSSPQNAETEHCRCQCKKLHIKVLAHTPSRLTSRWNSYSSDDEAKVKSIHTPEGRRLGIQTNVVHEEIKSVVQQNSTVLSPMYIQQYVSPDETKTGFSSLHCVHRGSLML